MYTQKRSKLSKQPPFSTRSRVIVFMVITIFSLIVSPVNAINLHQEAGPTYIVQSGDSLNEIAIRFGKTVDEILKVNEINDPNSISVGQSIIIPGLEGISGVLTSKTLPLGASLTALTRQYNFTKEGLITLNRFTSPSEMIAGVTLIIPIKDDDSNQSAIPSIIQGESSLERSILSGITPWILADQNQLSNTWSFIPGEPLFMSDALVPDQDKSPGMPQISINKLPIVQGETMQLKITTPKPILITADFNGRSFNCFTEDNENYYCFHGIHALAEPGIYPLRIDISSEGRSLLKFEQLIFLAPGYFEWQNVNISDLNTLDAEKSAEEDARIQPILDRATPNRFWEGQFHYPVDEPCSNDDFGARRDYNNGKLIYYHTGVDFPVCAQNLNIYAVASGEVIIAEALLTRGNTVFIDHGWGVVSNYAHLSEILVEVGDFVEQGDLIGIIGNTGRSAGPHLHLEIIVSGTPVNPTTWLNQVFP